MEGEGSLKNHQIPAARNSATAQHQHSCYFLEVLVNSTLLLNEVSEERRNEMSENYSESWCQGNHRTGRGKRRNNYAVVTLDMFEDVGGGPCLFKFLRLIQSTLKKL